jgi:glycosyltransferase involved in cell wall biosynthesis
VIHGEHGTLQLSRRQALVQRFAWMRTDGVLSVSSRLAERIARATAFPLERITVIRNGVDLARFGLTGPRDARAALGLPKDRIIIGAVGRLVPVKDHATLIAAIARLRQRGIDVMAVIAGDGPLRPELETLAAASGVGDRVRLLGYRPDVAAVLAALDVFVMCSQSEGLSNTILEAMATGLPVVATAVGGTDELVEPGVSGLLVPPGSPAELADALAVLAGSGPCRARMGEAGRARARAEFSLSAMVRRYEDLYLRLADAVVHAG